MKVDSGPDSLPDVLILYLFLCCRHPHLTNNQALGSTGQCFPFLRNSETGLFIFFFLTLAVK